MVRKLHFDPLHMREEIAQAAARMVAEDGVDYSKAKRKAAQHLLGHARIPADLLPSNEQIEEKIREYQALFQSDSQPARLRQLRLIALDWMQRLARFNPYLTGAVLNGTAGEHSDVHLQVFCDNVKEVAIYLLDAHIQYEVSETRHFAGRDIAIETLSFLWPIPGDDAVGIHIALYNTDDLRGAVRADARGRLARAHAQAVQALLNEDKAEDQAPSSAAPSAAPSSN